MRYRGPILKPRHLFPDTAAFLIEAKRTLLRVKWIFTKDQEWVPAWTVGACCGVVGLMLAVLLFFMGEPTVAAPVVDIPTLDLPIVITPPTKPVPAAIEGRSNLLATSDVRFTHIPNWDQYKLDPPIVSKPVIRKPTQQQLFAHNDPWRATLNFRNQVSQFNSYATRAMPMHATPVTVTSSDQISPYQAAMNERTLGLFVEKSMTPVVSVNEPTTYQIYVRNNSNEPIQDVVVRETLSAIHRVSNVVPPAAQQGDQLVWSLGTVPAGELKTLAVTIVPSQSELLIKTETELSTASPLSAKVKVSPETLWEPQAPEQPLDSDEEADPAVQLPRPFPELRLAVSPIKTLKTGETLSLIFTISNVGTAPAEDVDLFVNLSGEFEHRYGKRIKHHITRLEPGQTRRALLQAEAKADGTAQLDASLTMQGDEEEARELTIPIEPTTNTEPMDSISSSPSEVHTNMRFTAANP